MTLYSLLFDAVDELYKWIAQQPNLLYLDYAGIGHERLECEFDHSPSESVAFKRQLARRLFLVKTDDTTYETLAEKLEEIQTDQLLYTTSQSVTKTNIGTVYVNLYDDFSGRPFFVDTTGFTKLAIQILWTKVGTGTQTMQIVNNADSSVVIESPSLTTSSNEFTNVSIPSQFLNFKGKWRLQCKSTVAADDPVFSSICIYLRR